MFVIAGISPRNKKLGHVPAACPVCGLPRAYYRRVDHYFSLFFIPVFRVKKGDPFLMCEYCETNAREFGGDIPDMMGEKGSKSCLSCDKSFHRNYIYCPFCGEKL